MIIAKLDWYRAGGEVSERQWNDVTRLLKLHSSNLDWPYLYLCAQEIGVMDLLDLCK